MDPTANQEQLKKAAVVKKQVEEKKEEPVKPKIWSVDATFETHWMVVRDNLPENDVYHMLYLRGNIDPPAFWKIPALGRFSLRLELARTYVADPGESGFLMGDIRLYYSYPYAFSIKGQEFQTRSYFYWTFPTSKVSQKEGNIARPTLIFALAKQLPLNLSAIFRPFFRLNLARYAEAEGGMPNQKWIIGYDLQLIYTFHLHKRLSIGAGWVQDWYNRYAARDGYSQPWNSEYQWEVFAGYSIFQKPVALDAYLALASGRRTFEDGVWRFHFMDRDETEMYFSLVGRY